MTVIQPPVTGRTGATTPAVPGARGAQGTARPPITRIPAFPPPEPEVPAGATNAAGEQLIPPGTVKFNNAPLEQVFTYYADLVGRTIIKHPQLTPNSTITLIAQTPWTKKDAIQALDTSLAMNGITMIPEGEKFVLAVPSAQALQQGAAFTPVSEHTELPEASQFMTAIVRLTNAMPSEVLPAITPLAQIGNGIVPIENSQMLVLRDYAVNVKRMLEVLKKVDIYTEPDYKLDVIPIKYGKVDDIYPVMSSLIGGGAGGGAAPTRPATAPSRSRRGRGGAMGGGMGTSPYGGQGQFGMQGTTTPASPTGAQNTFQRNLQAIVAKAAGGETQILTDAKIIPDPRSNSLVVYANKKDMATITNIVAKLDVALAQVLIEAVIIDVTLGDNYSLGFSLLQNPKTSGKFTGAGGYNNGPGFLSAVTNLQTSLPTGFSYFGQWGGDLEAAVTALAANNQANVLQRPRIQTTHAVTAEFFVGSQEPYSAGNYGGYGYGGYGGYGYPSSFVQYLNVGIDLQVTPFITPDGLVLMQVSQTIDDLQGYVDVGGGQQAPRTTSRTADSTVSVKNHETIILGGFIRSSRSKTYSGVPILKDIPLLGALFRSTTKNNTRNELLVLLRPTVLNNPQEASQAALDEENRLPGVRRARKDFEMEEQQIMDKADKRAKKK